MDHGDLRSDRPRLPRRQDTRPATLRGQRRETLPSVPAGDREGAIFTNQRKEACPEVGAIEKRWGEAEADPLELYLGAFDADRLVAQVGFRPLMPTHPWYRAHGHFGMMVLAEYWGQGLGTRLLEEMEVHARRNGFRRVEATVRTANERGVALYRKANFQFEGTRRRAVEIDGAFHDEFYIAKLLD